MGKKWLATSKRLNNILDNAEEIINELADKMEIKDDVEVFAENYEQHAPRYPNSKKGRNLANPNHFKVLVLTYFAKCKRNNELPNFAGLLNFLKISRNTFNSLAEKTGYMKTYQFIKTYIEDKWVQELTKKTPTGAIFYLKNNFRDIYKDVIDHNVIPVPLLRGMSRKKIREKKIKDVPALQEGNNYTNE